jgi:hypothetical protein
MISRTTAACKYHEAAKSETETYFNAALEDDAVSRPNHYQAQWLRRIAQSPMMVTRVPGEPPRYSLQTGEIIPQRTAEILIRNGWLRAQRDGLFDDPQTYRAHTP